MGRFNAGKAFTIDAEMTLKYHWPLLRIMATQHRTSGH